MKHLKNITFVILITFSLYTSNIFANSEPVTISTVKVGNNPSEVVVNPKTNMVYVYNFDEESISVINWSGTVIATLTNIDASSLTINPITNKIYTDYFIVINGDDNKVSRTTLKNSYGYGGVAVDSITNTVYLTNLSDNTISVFSGSNNNLITNVIHDLGRSPSGIAINSNTNKIYVTSQASDSVSVIDWTTKTISTKIRVGWLPGGITVNPYTNTVYVANRDSNTVSVIDWNTNSIITTIGVWNNPDWITLNPNTNKIYVANYYSNSVSVIDWTNNELINTIMIDHNPSSMAINTSTNTLYTANFHWDNISIITNPDSTLYTDSQTNTDPWEQFRKIINDRIDNLFVKLDDKYKYTYSNNYKVSIPYLFLLDSTINKIDTLLKSNNLSEKYRVFLNVVKARLGRKIDVINRMY